MAKTGIKIKRANVGSVEAHNERTKEYLEGLKKAGKDIYFFPEFTSNNQSWVNPRYEGKTCKELFEDMKQLYRDKVGQEPNLQDREIIYKKTGKKVKRAGWSPIREGCPPIKEDTAIEDFSKVIDWARANGLDVIRIDLHHDEGHVDWDEEEESKNKPKVTIMKGTEKETEVCEDSIKFNRHAHIVFDWVDHETGKTIKLDDKKMSELQDIMADALGMERGAKKSKTGLDHIPAAEYRERKAAEHAKAMEEKLQGILSDLNDTISVIEKEENRAEQLRKTNDALERGQDSFAQNIAAALKSAAEKVVAAIEDTSAKKTLLGSSKDAEGRSTLRSDALSVLNNVVQNPMASLGGVVELPEEIRQEYRRLDVHAENNRYNDMQRNTETPAREKTNADLRKMHEKEARLLDEMNLQQLSEQTKATLLEGKEAKVSKQWYDPQKAKWTDKAEAVVSVKDWHLEFNGSTLRDFLNLIWMKMAKAAQELKSKIKQTSTLSPKMGGGFKL